MQATQPIAAARVFDHLAVKYDAKFTHSSIGRAQRIAVWECAQQVFAPRSRLLELNCGTGEDALHFARMGFQVTACDVSTAMIIEARRKAAAKYISNGLSFQVRSTEEIGGLRYDQPFGGVFSNFSGLNCVNDLGQVANALFPLLLPGAPLLLCFSTRYCLWEIVWYLLRGEITQASRRWSGYDDARISGQTLPVYYPKCEQIRQSFRTGFRLVSIYGIGITVPPSYVEPWIVRLPRLLHLFRTVDSVFRRSPGLRVVGDHMLLHFERLPS